MNEDSKWSVFVYGTLKPGGRYWPVYCEGKVTLSVPAKVRGELYDLHVGYPGLRLRGQDWVQGIILTFEREADFLELDVLEGYVPGRTSDANEYNRLRVQAFSPEEDAPLGEVWAYEITDSSMRLFRSSRILDGNWRV